MSFTHRAVLVGLESPSTLSEAVSRRAEAVAAPPEPVASSATAAPPSPLPTSLGGCHDLIRDLQQENVHLRQSGAFFGQLAEHFNHELRCYRDMSPDARRLRRGSLEGPPTSAPAQGTKANDH